MKLEGKIAVVTGASSGMGREIAKLFASEGATVIAVARRKERLDEIVEQTKGLKGTVVAFPGDVSSKEINEAMIDFAVKNYGKIDVLVNNAGIMDEMTPVHELTDELWDKVQKVNVYGPMCACRKAVNVMMEQSNGGVIVNVASVGGLHGARAGLAYTASKHALVGISENIGFMYANNKIRCNVLCPGGVDTEVGVNISHPSTFGIGRVMTGTASNPRSGQASEIATAALFLACDDSSLINGTTLVADAGWTAY
ncbi:MAG: SDR family oxidoreductase [Erysipelotrichaceae bacterium]